MHMKFLALIFVVLALLTVTTLGQGRFGGSTCECSGRRRLTSLCCEESRGFLRFDRCHREFPGRFLKCCELQGSTGACFA